MKASLTNKNLVEKLFTDWLGRWFEADSCTIRRKKRYIEAQGRGLANVRLICALLGWEFEEKGDYVVLHRPADWRDHYPWSWRLRRRLELAS